MEKSCDFIELPSNSAEQDSKMNNYSCSLCKEMFLKEDDLFMHKQLHQDSNDFKCFLCKERFSDLKELKAHDLFHSMTEAHEDVDPLKISLLFNEIYVCHFCNKQFDQDDDLMKHSMKHLVVKQNRSPQSKVSLKKKSRSPVKNHEDKKSRKLPVVQLERLVFHANARDHTCHICGKKFSSIQCLKQHQNIHLDSSPYTCCVCGKTFTQAPNLKRHLLIHECQLLSCELCGHKFSPERLAEHITQFHDPKKKHVCNICGKRFPLKMDLERHKNTHMGIKKFKCETCLRKFVHKSDLTRHSRCHLGLKPFVCNICNKSFVRNSHLQSHLSTHVTDQNATEKPSIHFMSTGEVKLKEKPLKTEEKPSHLEEKPLNEQSIHKKLEICYVCNRKFSKKIFLDKHFETAHKDVKANQCHICFKEFAAKSKLLTHMLLHKELKKLKCKHCTKLFSSSSLLQKHLSTHGKSKLINCQICHKTFSSVDSLKAHELLHKKSNITFRCELCSKAFISGKSLNEHSAKFHNLKRNECTICGKRFQQPYQVVRHMTSHNNEKNFKCSLCDKLFSRKDHLSRHELTHKGNKQFSCNVCPQTFSTKVQLKNHIAVHEEVQRFEHAYETSAVDGKEVTTSNKKVMKPKSNIKQESNANLKLQEKGTHNINKKKEKGLEKKLHGIVLNKKLKKVENIIKGANEKISFEKQSISTIDDKKKVTTDMKSLKRNTIKKHNSNIKKGHQCEVCGKWLAKESFLLSHRRLMHPVDVEDYICDHCGESFHEKFNLEVHLMNHKETTSSHKCKFCDSKFTRMSLMLNHVKKAHNS